MTAARAVQEESAETALVHEAMRGDRCAFGMLYERYARAIHGILLAHASYCDAEDLMQDVFTVALVRLPELRKAGAFAGWLASIARNRAREFHRKRKWKADGELERLEACEIRPEALDVLAAIRRLPECYAETLTLRFVEGMTGPEIAARTGLTSDSVRVNLCRGMKMLRELLSVPGVSV